MYKLFLLFFLCSVVIAQDINGFWKKFSDSTEKPECMLAVYKYRDKYFGRIVATYDKEGKMGDTIYAPKGRAPGVVGNPFYCGLDLVWNLRERDGGKYKGKIVDPEKGDVYDAEVWVRNGNLIVRGELFIFGKNVIWYPTVEADFGKQFKKPDVTKFVPMIPEVD